MRAWSVLVSADRFAAERLYHRDVIELDWLIGVDGFGDGDQVALIADVAPPVVFALARVSPTTNDDHSGARGDGAVALAYTQRFFDEPRPAMDLFPTDGPVRELAPTALGALRPPAPPPRTWFVSLDLPIEAESAAEAVRQFWSYVGELGPTELPTYVSPVDDELAMQAFVLGEEANQDPEED